MAQSLPLSLQAFPHPDKEIESLQYLIRRVNEQRGSFRNVSEQSLEEEIHNASTNEVEAILEDVKETVIAGEDVQTKREEVAKAKEDILRQIGQASAECQVALECVSLLLSKHAPVAAQTTMSPFLKEKIPLGSLGAEVVKETQKSEAEKQTEGLVTMGWRMQSLNGTADSLLKSASRLEEEMGKETKYWEQVLAVKGKGWSLHRLPREQHTLGIRYGFAEADPSFRDRGLAAVRRDEEGNLTLDRGLRSRVNRKLRVRILQQGQPIACSISGADDLIGDGSVERGILNARNSLYDEELHHELDREARNLVNQGVRCIDGNILLPYESGRQLEISLITLDEESIEEPIGSDNLVDAISIALRILLSYAHRQKRERRSQMPSPLLEQKASRPVYALLKPLLEHLLHRSSVMTLQSLLAGMKKTLAPAGIDLSFEMPTSSHNLANLSNLSFQAQGSAVDDLFRALTAPLHTTISAQVSNEPIKVAIGIHTTIQPPHFGTTYQVTGEGFSVDTVLPQSTQFTTASTLQSHILDLVTLALEQHVSNNPNDWRLSSMHTHTMTRHMSNIKDILAIHFTIDSLNVTWARSG